MKKLIIAVATLAVSFSAVHAFDLNSISVSDLLSKVEETAPVIMEAVSSDDSCDNRPYLMEALKGDSDDNDFKTMKALIASRCSLNTPDEDGDFPLIWSIYEIMKWKGYNWSGTRKTARNYKDIAKRLIKAGADVNVQDKGGNTPLSLAIVYGEAEIVEMLLKAGACQ